MSIKSRLKNAYSALISKKQPVPISKNLGSSGRQSVLEPFKRYTGKNRPIRPDEVTKSAGRRISYNTLVGQTVSQAVNTLINESPEVRSAVNTYIDFVIQDYILDSEDDAAIKIIEDFIEGMGGKSKFLSLLKQVAYGYYVEGAVCMELTGDTVTKEAKRIDYVSPWSIAAEKVDGPEGEYYRYGQINKISAKLDPVLYDEYDDTVENDYFKYVPADQQGTNPFGKSQIAATVFPAAALTNLITLMVQFLQGRVFPKHIYFPDYKAVEDMAITQEDYDEAQRIVTCLIEGQMNAADITEDVFSSVPIIPVLVGALERANIDGTELMADVFERQTQRGSRIPKTLFGTRREGNALNDNESRVEWGGWSIVVNSAQVAVQLPISEFFALILLQKGNNSRVNLKLLNEDVEIRRIHAEAADMKAQAFERILALGLYTREYLFRKFNDSSITTFDFSEATQDDFLEDEPQPTQPPVEDENNNE